PRAGWGPCGPPAFPGRVAGGPASAEPGRGGDPAGDSTSRACEFSSATLPGRATRFLTGKDVSRWRPGMNMRARRVMNKFGKSGFAIAGPGALAFRAYPRNERFVPRVGNRRLDRAGGHKA